MTESVRTHDVRPGLWTAWFEHFATGEGHSMMAYIAYARDEASIRQQFAKKFGEWYGKGCAAAHGVVRNDCTEFLLGDATLNHIERTQELRGLVEAHAKVYINLG